MKQLLVLIALAAVATGCGSSSGNTAAPPTPSASRNVVTPSPSPSPTSITFHPIMVIKVGSDPGFAANFHGADRHHCHGVNGYDDLKVGGAVTMYGPSGSRIVGTGEIKNSLMKHNDRLGLICILTGTVRHVEVLPFYKVQFANRNKLPFSRQEILGERHYTVIG